MLKRAAYRFESDHPPGVDINIAKIFKERVQFPYILVVDDRRDLYRVKPAFLDQVAHSRHRPLKPAGHSPQAVMGFRQSVHTDRDRSHAGLMEPASDFAADQRPVRSHPPPESPVVNFLRQFKESPIKQRLSARQADLRHLISVTRPYLIEHPQILSDR